MRKETAFDFCLTCLNRIADGGAGAFIENPAARFTAEAKAGAFDGLTDEEYEAALGEAGQLASIWNGKARMTAGDLLPCVPERMPASPGQRAAIAGPLAELPEWPDPERPEGSAAPGPELRPVLERTCEARSPREIRDAVSRRVIGQPEAVRAAAMITHNHLSGRCTNAVFAGPSGCGKSEIWRALSEEYPGLVRMVDFSRFSAEGWNGSLRLRDIFEGISSDAVRKRGLIVVLDEADKILCERAVGAGGTDHKPYIPSPRTRSQSGAKRKQAAEKKPPKPKDEADAGQITLGGFASMEEAG